MNELSETLNYVEARLNYGGRGGRRPMRIYDARPLTDSLSLDVEGFALKRCSTAVSNFYDPAQVRSIYYPEIEQLVKQATGATKVTAFEHDVRCAPKARLGEGAVREPVKVVHDDYTEKSAPERVRLYLPKEADILLQSRYEVVNVWRAIGGPVAESPLTVCDARSIREEEVVPTEEGVKHEVYLFNFSPRHQWFYFPGMEKDEALLIKCFDSLDDGRVRLTAHSAFDDPTTPPDAHPRESIEVRTLAFFAPGE
ncbi:MAG: methyltransferase [Deltaproteobacteria bacterium]|nr:methyltransferase [Deltaproteobacteria bacterium]